MDQRLSQGLAALAACFVVIASWQWGYQAAVRAYARDKQHIESLKGQLAQAEAMIQAAGGEATWRTRNEQRLAKLKTRFPQQTQLPQLLTALVDSLKVGGLTLLNVEQGNLEPVRDMEQPVLIDGAPCFRLPVKVTAEGRYHALLAALERFTSEAFPCVLSVQQVEVRLKDSLSAQLDATLQLYLYVVASSPGPSPTG